MRSYYKKEKRIMGINTNSVSIRNIENKYGIDLTTCTRKQLDLLTSKNSSTQVITKLEDLMLGMPKFDTDNMSDIEKANLKYLVMSTEEVLETLNRKSKSIYYKPSERRLRWLMSFHDFYQICAYKLLLNDGILHFDANYKLDPAIHCWLLRTAIWQTTPKANVADEVTLMDQSVGEEEGGTTVGELLAKDIVETPSQDKADSDSRINWILSEMDKTPNNRIVLKANNTVIPFSEYTLAKLFIVYQVSKKELSKIMYNTTNNKLVSNQIFNKFYKKTLMHIAKLLNREASYCDESFNINEEEL